MAEDYYRAVTQIEQCLAIYPKRDTHTVAPNVGELLALVDAFRNGTVNESQREIVDAMRAGIATLMK